MYARGMHSPLWLRILAWLVCCASMRGQGPLIPISLDAVKSAPFTLTVRTHREIAGSPGSERVTQRIMRDSAGRQRYDAPLVEGLTGPRLVDIYDTIASKHYALNMDSKTVEVSSMRPGNVVSLDATDPMFVAPSAPAEGQKLLGTRNIAGLEAWGQITSKLVTRSDGSPVMQSSELWLSAHYRMPLLHVRRTPQIILTEEVTAFQSAEPNAALFRVPEGFSVHDAPEPRQGLVSIGGEVSAPVLLKSVNPTFTDQARAKKLNGEVLLSFLVDEQGVPQGIRVLHGLGLGLDEQATKAVRQYRFKPAMRNGIPVKVELHVSVKFQIF